MRKGIVCKLAVLVCVVYIVVVWACCLSVLTFDDYILIAQFPPITMLIIGWIALIAVGIYLSIVEWNRRK